MNSDKILDILTSTSEYVSGQSLAQTLGVSRQAVWKEINALRERGYEIESVPNRGYRLSATPAFPDAHAVNAALNTKIIGKELTVLDSVGSTNDYLKNLSKQNLSQQHCARYGFSFTGCPYDGHLKQTLILDASIEDGFTSVYGLNPLCGARTVHGCFRKLKKGECKDPFVIENIGKVFWPDKYGKQR